MPVQPRFQSKIAEARKASIPVITRTGPELIFSNLDPNSGISPRVRNGGTLFFPTPLQ